MLAPGSSTRDRLQAVPYDKIQPGKPPIPITVPPPSSARLGIHPLLRPTAFPTPSDTGSIGKLKKRGDVRRDSGLATPSSTVRESRTTIATDVESSASLRKSPSPTNFTIHQEGSRTSLKKFRRWGGSSSSRAQPTTLHQEDSWQAVTTPFQGITTDIPSSNLADLSTPGKVDFSKRGSMLIAGKRANELEAKTSQQEQEQEVPNLSLQLPATPNIARKPTDIPIRVISEDDETLSQKVRSLYQAGTDGHVANRNFRSPQAGTEGPPGEHSIIPPLSDDTVGSGVTEHPTSHTTIVSQTDSSIKRDDTELAGGIEDWDSIDNADVDRYGFIIPRKADASHLSSDSFQAPSPEPPRLQRVSTLLQLASEAPRRQRSTLGRNPSINNSVRSTRSHLSAKPEDAQSRPVSSQGSYQSSIGRPSSRLRQTANRFPHNRNRRWMDEAGDMLTSPPGLADIAENEESKVVDEIKRKESEREEKWRKMAKVVKHNRDGGGMVFEFDTRSPKLIERTWKGIPDSWRATAWYAFLTASARRRPSSTTDAQLKASFRELVDQSSPDDVQIDIDVPRTINSHIMFRRRYRGGQRLLFRVLHCLSIYFPDTGYVQGMAALAATILCYFEEEMAFVMLVRMWQLRGIARLYRSGFDGLMEALDDFEKNWLSGNEVAARLTSLGISPTAYGTRWYLTIFNYSIPFPAQLRVWDVFMLLDDTNIPAGQGKQPHHMDFSLDIVHATSAALIDGTRDILLDSDFENAMKVLTSWIPVKDEELLMKVAKAEWKLHRRKK
ncbi:MAG: hypothetical protein MMC33_003271 [Icmadophila ericetorum]|nr:hypothetical protein [Icmadophila ericetorum]